MATYNVLEAKTRLSKLIEAVESGAESEVVIARNGKPAVRIVPLAKPQRKPVRLGLAAATQPDWLAQMESPEAEEAYQAAWRAFWREDISTGEDFEEGDPRGMPPE